jgi:hypothetical protein
MSQEITLTRHISLFAKDILDYLKSKAIGKENAIKINVIAFHFEKSRREIEQAIEELRSVGAPIASSVSSPYGVFLARSYTEMEAWVRQIDHRFKRMAINKNMAIQALKAQAMKEGIQTSLELEVA